MSEIRGKELPLRLADVLDLVLEAATVEQHASFRELVIAAGLNPSTDFVGAKLIGIDLTGEDLRGFDFSHADLRNADFSYADVEDVLFDGANLTGAKGLPPELTGPDFLSALESIPNSAIVSKDLNGKILAWNEAATRIYGYTREEAINRRIEDLIIAPGKIQEELHLRSRVRGGQVVEKYETERRKKDGTLIKVSISIAPVKDGGGNIVAATGFSQEIEHDLEARRRREAEPDEEESAVVSKDLGGRILSWNGAAARIYGYTSEEAIGKNVEEIIIVPYLLDEEKIMRSKIANGETILPYKTTRRCKDGSLIGMSVSLQPIYDAAHNVIGATGFARKI